MTAATPGYRLESGPRGKLTLRVYYDPALRDWDRRTDEAVKATGVDRKATLIICCPAGGRIERELKYG
jgi:hypothetical protein